MYIIELNMTNKTDGYYDVVVQGERHLNRTKIRSSIQFFTREGGYCYNHPEDVAKRNAQAMADGLNAADKKAKEEYKAAREAEGRRMFPYMYRNEKK